ncbi:MAG: hypothetical protein IJX88_03305 [Clostridia bacterium]|nr:hypothetical protein [Clostridia bacterium]
MKKVKSLLVSLLVVIMALFCFAGCGEKGKYVVTSYKMGGASLSVTSDSYIELKDKDVAEVSISIMGIFTLEGTGTWKTGDDNKVTITLEGVEYTATVADDVMTFGAKDSLQIILNKQK